MTLTTTPPVTFVYADFIAQYPEFGALTDPQLAGYFQGADSYFANSTTNPAFRNGVVRMTYLMYLLTAHVAWLMAPRDANGNPSATGSSSSPIVGRVSSASEGSVSVSAEWKGSGTPSEEWFTQTKYGAMWWQATAQYRTARYMANPVYVPSSLNPLYPRGRFPGRRFV